MERRSFIGNYRDLFGADDARYPDSHELLSHGAPIGRRLGLQGVGVHIERLTPGRRTSWPHAERYEEEFAYVISGSPQAWIDGHAHDLAPGDLVALPAGTGIAHTFLNNSGADALLLVGGESVPRNEIIYPVHDARNAQCRDKGWLWEGAPARPIGPHDGLTDSLRAAPLDPPQSSRRARTAAAGERPEFIGALAVGDAHHSHRLGMRALAVHLERLEPGQSRRDLLRSSECGALAFVLEGLATLSLTPPHSHDLAPGDGWSSTRPGPLPTCSPTAPTTTSCCSSWSQRVTRSPASRRTPSPQFRPADRSR